HHYLPKGVYLLSCFPFSPMANLHAELAGRFRVHSADMITSYKQVHVASLATCRSPPH
ncbi:unnamed protein product, partial [Musa banksii]